MKFRKMKRKMTWELYRRLWRVSKSLAWKMHGPRCPNWCQGHSDGANT